MVVLLGYQPAGPDLPADPVALTTARTPARDDSQGCTGCRAKLRKPLRRLSRFAARLARHLHLLTATNTQSGRFPRPATHAPYPLLLTYPRGPAAPPAAGLFFSC